MISNYFKTAFRNLWKNKGYSLLNISGLAIGIACAALIFLWVEDEMSYNDYFANKANLYNIKNHQTYDGNTVTFDATPGKLAHAIKQEVPGIRNTARSTWGNPVLFSVNEKHIYENGLYVDSSFLSMFELEFVKGNAHTAFNELYALVLTEKTAQKFFGTIDVLGKNIKVDNSREYIISGVVKDLPKNVSLRFGWLAPFKLYENNNSWLEQWGNNGIITYVETDPKANVARVDKQLYNFLDTKQEGLNAKFSIYNMSRWRLYNNFKNGVEAPGRIKFVNLFSIIAWIILIIACINFMNLSTARSEQRAKEVGVRKVMGAARHRLVFQFISESLIMAFISALLAIVIIYIALSGFNTLVEKTLEIDLLNPLHSGGLFLIALICGIVAGSYPAFYLSSFSPIRVLKGLKIQPGGSAASIRKGLVVVQFSISVILIICTILIYQQVNHVKERNLGYNKQDLLYASLQGNMKTNFSPIKNQLINSGIVENAALSNSPVLQMSSNTGDFSWPGKDPSKQVLITTEYISPEYVSTMGMTINEGRDFYPDAKSDSNNILINEALAKLIQHKNIVGSIISRDGGPSYTVVGVIKDFIYNNMYSSGEPAIFFPDISNTNFLSIRLKPNTSLSPAMASIENIIKSNNPGYPFEYKFVDDQFDQFFKTETLVGKLAGLFALLAIIISCLGLFGLAAYTAERRTKEIGIRKVLGASTRGLANLLSKDFLKLVTISCLIAFPVAWWMMKSWLQSYEYRVTIGWQVFLLAAVLAIIIAWITVSFQAVKAALANPVKSLRTE